MVEAGLRQSVLAVRVEHALNRHGTIYKLRVNIKYAKDAIPAGGSERMEKKLAAMLAKERKLRDALRPSVRKKLLEELRQRLGP